MSLLAIMGILASRQSSPPPSSNHDFTVTSQQGGVSVAWTEQPVDFTVTPTQGGVTVTWSE
jgi:hypothetical protein